VITIGVDAHKAVHVAVAVDDAGRDIGQWRGRNSVVGWKELQPVSRLGNVILVEGHNLPNKPPCT